MRARADNKFEKEQWCLNYIKVMHEITMSKYEEITAYLAIVNYFPLKKLTMLKFVY
jgi:hypothetical protein